MSMRLSRRVALASALAMPAIVSGRRARAQTGKPVKIGMITTLSGPGGYLGGEIRDAFMLAVENDTLGGVPVQVIVEDDGLKPAQAKQIANRFLKSEQVRLFTGIVFSNVLEAIVPDVLDDDAIYVSPNAAPSSLAGKNCNKNYWVVSWQNDTLHEAAGANANRLGYKKMYVLAPNYQAGKDAITGFKRIFKGEIVGESYTRLDQTDFAPEMAQIRAAAPDAVFQFHPGGLGIAFMRQYQQAGHARKNPDGACRAVARHDDPCGGRRGGARGRRVVALELGFRQSRQPGVRQGVRRANTTGCRRSPRARDTMRHSPSPPR